MALDLSDDYLAVDLAEPVVITSRSTVPPIYDEEIEVAYAFRGKLTYRELVASSGAAIRMEATFDIPKTLTPGYTWKPGDTITDQDDNTYNIWSSEVDPGTAFWRFVVYNPKIAYDLRHTIDVYLLETDKDSAGATTYGAETLQYEDIDCRVQWVSGGPASNGGIAGEKEKAVVTLGQRLRLSNNSLIRWYDPDYQVEREFDIVAWNQPDRLDVLMQVEVEAKP